MTSRRRFCKGCAWNDLVRKKLCQKPRKSFCFPLNYKALILFFLNKAFILFYGDLYDNFIKLVSPKIILCQFVLLSNDMLGFIHLFIHLLDRIRQFLLWLATSRRSLCSNLTWWLGVVGLKPSIIREDHTSQSAWWWKVSWTRWWLDWVLEEEWGGQDVLGGREWHDQGYGRQSQEV